MDQNIENTGGPDGINFSNFLSSTADESESALQIQKLVFQKEKGISGFY